MVYVSGRNGTFKMNAQEDHVYIGPLNSIQILEVGFLNDKCAIKIFDKHLELNKRFRARNFGQKCVV
jgi:hypothetical protein